MIQHHKILVTGGGGFIGSHLVQHLLDEGQSVRILELPSANVEHLKTDSIEVVRGDIRNADDVRQACHGCDWVLHLAANPNLWSKHPKEFETINHQGTRTVLQVAHELKIKRMVYVSTESILISPNNSNVINEKTETFLSDMRGPYCRSKWLAEHAAREAQEKAVPLVIVNPTVPIGPGDRNQGPLSRVIQAYCRNQIKGYMEGVINLIDVRDVAAGIWAAAHRGMIGERYLLSNENWQILELFQFLSTHLPVKPPFYKVPYSLALGFAWFEEQFCNYISNKHPLATVCGIQLSHHSRPFDADHSIRELGLQLRHCRSTLIDMLHWMAEEQHIQTGLILQTDVET